MNIFQKVSELEITEKTKLNILRKSNFVDVVQLDKNGTPLFSWIDISLTELCNRVCEFCPRVDPSEYPNQNLNMSIELASKLSNELREMDYKGGVVFCGYGEPLLHPQLCEIITQFRGIHVEVVTNGDKLNVGCIKEMFNAGLSFICVSMYDGPHQVEHFNGMFKEAGIDSERYILRDRWHNEEDSFGLKLTNRSGVMNFGPNHNDFNGKPCYYTAYSMAIDWNGDVLLCVQDWNKRIKFGNIGQENVYDIWNSLRLHKYRSRLIDGKRTLHPCNVCNADGTVHGFNHVNNWMRIDQG
jgi:radical SAM protein with 4Fe4S-binding SPASM domain